VRSFAGFLLLAAFALPLRGAYASRDLVLPVVGRVTDPMHAFRTMLWITNVSDTTAHVTLEFFATASSNAEHRPTSAPIILAPHATYSTQAIGAELIPTWPGIGALRIHADQRVVATARVTGGLPDDAATSSATFSGIPAEVAIRSGEATLLHGASFTRPSLERDKLYIVETEKDALQCTVSIVADDGSTLEQNALLLHPYEHQTIDLGLWFPTVRTPHATVRVRAMNGGGAAIVAMSSTVERTHDVAAMEMTIEPLRKRGLPNGEALVYGAAAVAVIFAAWRARPA
jgi:hypothetical protein